MFTISKITVLFDNVLYHLLCTVFVIYNKYTKKSQNLEINNVLLMSICVHMCVFIIIYIIKFYHLPVSLLIIM